MTSSAIRFALVLAGWFFAFGSLAQGYDLPEIQKRGQIRIALYNEFSPFSGEGKGIDVDLAQAMAGKLGVKMVPLWFDADESMEDDLRNMVWKGHYLGYGPADAMMHVPVDRDYMAKNDKVKFFAPYYRERFAIAHDLSRIPKLDGMAAFEKEKIGVEGGALPHTALLSADAGKYRNTIVQFRNAQEAILALKRGEVAAVMGQRGELEGGLSGTKGFAISDPPIPVLNRRQWALGLAVKAEHEDLARALQQVMNELVAEGAVASIFAKYGVQLRTP